ncbi:hypothetical protein CHLRE_09g395325v5 [Chlamydomonas reinhardtii]|uniref:DUF1764-domain-containing protein n=1 Tax=Chlamydomonas reinhardtii TaxID=3055 RepID=A8J0C9_CHLRE|nr:uncharacterized protein CHLRE_09g395325v5 [Chlamydomonas reinhardtii]PNW78943.1 hypothetical protein CHLRE_09g395325v5 [Chlamydomonas reinhardtii]|eukprot:XP_001694774.1 predicted protein [Chlamydomonas reinhardtii]
MAKKKSKTAVADAPKIAKTALKKTSEGKSAKLTPQAKAKQDSAGAAPKAAPKGKQVATTGGAGGKAEEKAAGGGKKAAEIDDIFSAGKKKAAENAKEKEKRAAEQAEQEPAAKVPKVAGNKDDIFGEQTGKGRKRTEEGFAIYTEDELGLGRKGGDTDLCPFDCECCF